MFETVGRRVDVDARRRRALTVIAMLGLVVGAAATVVLAGLLRYGERRPVPAAEPPLEVVLIEVLDAGPGDPPPLPARGGGAPEVAPAPTPAPPEEAPEVPPPLDEAVPDAIVDAAPVAQPGPYGIVPGPPGPPGGGGGGGGAGDGDGDGVVTAKNVKARRRIIPDYPRAASAMGLGAQECRSRLFIDERGVPYDVRFDDCPEVFHASAREALLKWRFYPAKVDGQPVRAQFVLNVLYVAN